MSDTATPSHRHRNWMRGLIFFIIVLAAWLRYGGFNRPIAAHPDQARILSWMNRAEEDGYLRDTAYPGGFFTLFVQYKRCISPLIKLAEWWRYQQNETNRSLPPPNINYHLGRHFNVWLAALTCGLAYLFMATVTGTRWPGIIGAALFCFAPDHIVHAHYLETDIATVFTLTLALWLWARFAALPTAWRILAAAIASGFAAGTKYYLLCLLPISMVFCFYRHKKFNGQPIIPYYYCLRMAALIFVAFVIGFVLATPAVWDGQAFLKNLQWNNWRVYNEGLYLAGQARGEQFLRLRTHWQEFARTAAATLSWSIIVSALLGIFVALTQAHRRFWPVTLGFPLIYIAYYLFFAPWVRSQEFLPLLPAVIGLAVLFAKWCVQKIPKENWRAPAIGAAVLLLCLPLMPQGCTASAQFRWKDTRVLAKRWLQRHSPKKAILGVENYTEPAYQDVCQQVHFIRKIETAKYADWSQSGFDFILRNPTSQGRAIRHPVTGRRYANYQAAFESFTNQATLLCRWGRLPPDYFKSPFISPDLELWATKKFTALMSLDLPLLAPAFVSEAGRETFFAANRHLGAAETLLVDRYPRQCAFGDAKEIPTPIFLIAYTLERATKFYWHGFGHRSGRKFSPYQAEVFELARGKWPPRLNVWETLTLFTESRANMVYVPCFIRPAYDIVDAAAILQQLGHTAIGLQLLQRSPEPSQSERGQVLLYLLAVTEKNWPLAERLSEQINVISAKLQSALKLAPEEILANGVNGNFYNQFARIRLTALDTPLVLNFTPQQAEAPEYLPMLPAGATWQLPVRLARGTYRLHGTVKLSVTETDFEKTPDLKVYNYHGECLTAGLAEQKTGDFLALDLPLTAASETPLWFHFVCNAPLKLTCKDLELSWTIHDQIRTWLNALVAAQARHQLHLGRPAEALAILEHSVAPCWNLWEQQCLSFAAQTALSDKPQLQRFAETLLKTAPYYWPAQKIVAPTTAMLMEANLAKPIHFPPWLQLIGFYIEKDVTGRQKYRLVFEVMAEGTPPLKTLFYRRHKGHWRNEVAMPLDNHARYLKTGERVAITCDPQAQWGVELPPTEIALALQADVRWLPSRLTIEGQNDTRIELARVAAATAATGQKDTNNGQNSIY